jgi:hypothetical protein
MNLLRNALNSLLGRTRRTRIEQQAPEAIAARMTHRERQRFAWARARHMARMIARPMTMRMGHRPRTGRRKKLARLADPRYRPTYGFSGNSHDRRIQNRAMMRRIVRIDKLTAA